MRLQTGNGRLGMAQHMAVCRGDKFNLVRVAGVTQAVQRIEVGIHVAVGRVNHRCAAIQNVVAAEQNAVFEQHQAQVVGGMPGRVYHLQCMNRFALQPREYEREQLLIL